MDLFDLVAKITLDSDEAESGVSSFGDKLKSGLGTAAAVGGAAIAAVGTATVALGKAMVNGASETAAYGDNIDKMSQKMGLSAEAYQEWDAIMQHSGTSIESMQRGMTTLSSAVENGSEAFEAIGISLEDAASMSQEDLFSATITALQNMEAGTERTVLAQKLLGGSAKELGALLNTSAEDTEAMRQRVHELGGVMSDEAVKAAASYQDSLQDMQTAFKGLSRGMLANLMPGITTVMDGLTELFSGDSDSGIAMISEGIQSLVDTISTEMPRFLELGVNIIQSLLQAIINNLPVIMESGAEILGELIAGLITAIPKLIVMAPQIVLSIIKGLIGAWPKIKEAGAELVNMLGNGISSVVNKALTWGGDLIQNFINGIKAKATALWDEVKGIAGGIADFLGFSEPKEGPLSNFHTYAPDMMRLFAQGIRDNESVITNQIGKSFDFGDSIGAGLPSGGVAYGSGGGNVFNLTVNVDGANVQDDQDLAERISYEIKAMFDREAAAYA